MIGVLWPKPRGGDSSSGSVTENDDSKVHTDVRRFIVIETNRLFCNCVYVICSRAGVYIKETFANFGEGQLPHMEVKAAGRRVSISRTMP